MNINELISKLSIEEKCSLLVGKNIWETNNIDRLSIPSIFMADGPHGLRKVVDLNNTVETISKAVCYPSLVTLASSFDPKLAFRMGESIGKECNAQGVNVILGPGINIKRHPFCGRNFEYFSEDPVVTTKMAEGFIKGVKSQNIGVCIKHYALNSQEDYRMTSSSIVDKRAKYEIYYKSFMELVKLEPEMVMCSYNKVDGIYASENFNLLQEVLRDEFGFKGVIVSDWGAVNVRTKALIASLDLEMPGHQSNINQLVHDYKKGYINLKTIDASVRRILTLIDKFKNQEIKKSNLDKNHNVSSNIAAESMVLLKNSDDLLPLKNEDHVLLIGDMTKNIRYQGGGSSHINSHKVDTIYDYLTKHENIDYIQGYSDNSNESDDELLYQIKNLAPNYSKIIIVCGLTEQYESEGYDREHLSIPKNQEYIINQVSKLNENIILVMQMGSPVVMPFIHNVKAILNCYLSGEGLGLALDQVLFSKVNPSGRLAETFPKNYHDVPSDKYYKTGNNNVYYQESIYVGYRYYMSNNMNVLFPFGHGLSYSHFEYSNMVINKDKLTTLKQNISISIDVTNNGPIDGKEVVLLFFEAKNPKTPRPKRELIGFDKVLIKNGETKTIKFKVNSESFNYYNIKLNKFTCDDGIYNLQFCKNARNILMEKSIEVSLGNEYVETIWNDLESYVPLNGLTFSDIEYMKLINRKIEKQHLQYKRPFTVNNSLEDIQRTFIGKIFASQLEKKAKLNAQKQGEEYAESMLDFIKQMPLRALALLSRGELKLKTAHILIELINFRLFKVLKYILKRN